MEQIYNHNQIVDSVMHQAYNQIVDEVFNQIINQVMKQVGNQIFTQIDNQRVQCFMSILDQVDNHVWDEVCPL